MLFFWLKCIKPRPNRFSETGFHGWFNNLKLFITLEVKPTIKIIFRKFGWLRFPTYRIIFPIPSMYGIFTYIWLIFMVNVGKYIPYMDGMGLVKTQLLNGLWTWREYSSTPFQSTIQFLRGISLSVESLPSKKKINFGRFFTFVWST